jgi:RNA polymerase sigma factor (sigma-70 family)
MSPSVPDSLRALLTAPDGDGRQRAWTAFLEEHTGFLLHGARHLGGDHDAVMDRYLYVIQALRENDLRRLRAYAADGRGKFSTWLLVVVRRLCYDHHRARYGRPQSSTDDAVARQLGRRQLVDLVSNELGLSELEARQEEVPDEALGRRELRGALTRALGELPPADRLLLRLRFEDSHSVPEVARMIGESSPFVIYRKLDKVLATLRRALEAGGVDDPRP